MVIRDLFERTGAYRERMNAFNILRVNANSAQTRRHTVDANGDGTNTVNSSGYRYSGNWNRCWMEPGPNTNDAHSATPRTPWCPGWTSCSSC